MLSGRISHFSSIVSNEQTYLRNQHSVTLLHAHRYPLAFAVKTTGSDGQDLGLVQLLNGGLGQEDAAGRLGLSLHALYQDAVEEGSERADGFQSGRLYMDLLVGGRGAVGEDGCAH